MTHLIWGVGLSVAGILLWRFAWQIGWKAYRLPREKPGFRTTTQMLDHQITMNSFRKYACRIAKLAGMALMAVGSWQLTIMWRIFLQENAADAESMTLVIALLFLPGIAFIILFQLGESKAQYPLAYRMRNWKGHVGWVLTGMGCISIFSIYLQYLS